MWVLDRHESLSALAVVGFLLAGHFRGRPLRGALFGRLLGLHARAAVAAALFFQALDVLVWLRHAFTI